MPVVKASGEENLRADPSVKTGSTKASPSGGGKDAGGTQNRGATTVTKSNPGKRNDTYSRNVKPAGVQTFGDGRSV